MTVLRTSLAIMLIACTALLFATTGQARMRTGRHHAVHHRHSGSHAVRGYYRWNGSYVRPHRSQ